MANPMAALETTSNLLSLPPELRNNIWDKLGEDYHDKTINVIGSESSTHRPVLRAIGKPRKKKGPRKPDLRFRLTCRQICQEATPLVLEKCSIGLYLRGKEEKRYSVPHLTMEIAAFTNTFRPRLELITHVELGLDDQNLFLQKVIKSRPALAFGTPLPQQSLIGRTMDWIAGTPGLIPLDFHSAELHKPLNQLNPEILLPNVTTVTLHSSLPDRFDLSQGQGVTRTILFVFKLQTVFAKLRDIRILTGGASPRAERYRLASHRGPGSMFGGVWVSGVIKEWYSSRHVYAYKVLGSDRPPGQMLEIQEVGETQVDV